MDLSNLSSQLPSGRSQKDDGLARELACQFKNAANAVAALYNNHDQDDAKTEFSNAARAVTGLYRTATKSQAAAVDQGYTECLEDLLTAIQNGEDIEDWALTRRAQIRKEQDNDDERNAASDKCDVPLDTEGPEGPYLADLAAPDLAGYIPDHVFTAPLLLAAPQHFHPSMPPLSVAHTVKQRAQMRRKPRMTKEDSSDSESDSGRKRRKMEKGIRAEKGNRGEKEN